MLLAYYKRFRKQIKGSLNLQTKSVTGDYDINGNKFLNSLEPKNSLKLNFYILPLFHFVRENKKRYVCKAYSKSSLVLKS